MVSSVVITFYHCLLLTKWCTGFIHLPLFLSLISLLRIFRILILLILLLILLFIFLLCFLLEGGIGPQREPESLPEPAKEAKMVR